MLHSRTGEGRPLWGRAVYTALHGARLSSVPSGDQSANPASVPERSGLQRAFLSVSSAQKCRGAGKLATPSGVSRAARSAVPCRPPFQGTELAALSTPEASLERLVPLVGHPAAWEPLPNVSRWVTHTVEQGYVALCRSLSTGEQALVMEQEVGTLLREETIEVVPALDKESRFYSRTSLFRGKGLRPS